MGKLNIHPTPEMKSEKYAEPKVKKISRKRNFEVIDADALYAAFPQFMKLVPDYAKIRQALKLGLSIPGLAFSEDSVSEEDDQ